MTDDKLRTRRADWLLLFALFCAASVLHGLAGDFPKQLTIYKDEWYYYSIADSLQAGRGILVQGASVPFQKIGYSLFLAPFFGIHDPVLRVRLIGWMNSFLLMSSVFPVWLIGRELGLRRGYRWLVAAAACFLPETLITATFMAENLYYPLVFWAVWLWMVAGRTRDWRFSLAGGVLACLAYTVKEAFLALAAAFILLDAVRLFRSRRESRSVDRKQLACLLTYAAVFAGLALAVRLVFFSSLPYTYEEQLSLAALDGADKWAYLGYAVLYYVAATLCAACVFPLILPLIFRRRMEEQARRFTDLVFLYMGVTILFIAFSIALPEDMGDGIPRFNFRYYAPAVPLLLSAFALCVQEGADVPSRHRFICLAAFPAAAMLLIALLFRGSRYGSCVEQFSLAWFDEIYWFFHRLGQPDTGVWLFILALGILVLISVLLVWRRRLRAAAIVCAAVLTAVFALDWVILIPRLRHDYRLDPGLAEEIRAVNKALANAPEESNLLVLADRHTDLPIRNGLDTYLEVPCRVEAPDHVNQAHAVSPGLPVTPVKPADWVLVSGSLLTHYRLPDCEPVDTGVTGSLRLFRCRTPGSVTLVPDPATVLTDAAGWETPLEICFYGENGNAGLFVTGGVYGPEDGFSWTAGHEVFFEIQTARPYETVTVELDVGDPFNGSQPFEVWCEGEMVYSSEVFEPDSFLFDLHPTEPVLSFSIRLPEAVRVIDVRPESGDGRCVAIQLRRMALWVDGDSQL